MPAYRPQSTLIIAGLTIAGGVVDSDHGGGLPVDLDGPATVVVSEVSIALNQVNNQVGVRYGADIAATVRNAGDFVLLECEVANNDTGPGSWNVLGAVYLAIRQQGFARSNLGETPLKCGFNIDAHTCTHCGGAVRIVVSIEVPTAIRAPTQASWETWTMVGRCFMTSLVLGHRSGGVGLRRGWNSYYVYNDVSRDKDVIGETPCQLGKSHLRVEPAVVHAHRHPLIRHDCAGDARPLWRGFRTAPCCTSVARSSSTGR